MSDEKQAPPRVIRANETHPSHDLVQAPAGSAFTLECARCGMSNFPGNDALTRPCAAAPKEAHDGAA